MKFKFLITLTFVFIGSGLIFSAPPPPSGGGGTPNCWPPPCVPIDGGISILIVAGAAYSARKIYDSHKKNKVH